MNATRKALLVGLDGVFQPAAQLPIGMFVLLPKLASDRNAGSYLHQSAAQQYGIIRQVN
jgi:hypothetical protein